jgi:RNA polymerase sigma factor (sigma-70 family)
LAHITMKMQKMDDYDLLAEYSADGAEGAFTALADRYVNLVYSAALRQVHDPHLAEEVTQVVFILLARKARSFRQGVILSGWLLRSTRFTAANMLISQFRRIRREQQAVEMQTTSTGESTWEQVAPLLDEALAHLGDRERNVIALRFFEQKPLKEVGAALGIDEDAAQKRVARAVERLRKFFVKRGVILSAMAMVGMLQANAVQAAPAGVASAVAAIAAVKGAAAAGSTATLLQTTLKVMAWSKLKIAAVATVGVLLAATTSTLIVKELEQQKTYDWEVLPVDGAVLDKTPPQVTIVPSKIAVAGSGSSATGDRWMGLNLSAEFILRWLNGWGSSVRMVRTAKFPEGNFDFISNLPQGSPEALRKLYVKKFGLAARRETRDADVLLLKVKVPNAPGLKPGTGVDGWSNADASFSLANFLEEHYLRIPVIDQTGLAGNFDFELAWGDPASPVNLRVEQLKQALLDQYGLELVPERQPIEMLVVEKAK